MNTGEPMTEEERQRHVEDDPPGRCRLCWAVWPCQSSPERKALRDLGPADYRRSGIAAMGDPWED